MTGKTTSFDKNLFDFRPPKCRICVGRLSQLLNGPGPSRQVKNESFDETKNKRKMNEFVNASPKRLAGAAQTAFHSNSPFGAGTATVTPFASWRLGVKSEKHF